MAKNVVEFEVEAQHSPEDSNYGWAQFSSPVEILHMTSKARTLPSSHGSSGSVNSSQSSLEPPPEEQSGAESAVKKRWSTTEIVLIVTAVFLLFGAGILGGLVGTGGLSRNDKAESANNGNATATDTSPGVEVDIFEEPSSAPVDSSLDPPPANPPTDAPTSNGWVPIPSPPSPLTLADGTYDYRANSDFLVGVYYYPWHKNDFHNNGGYLRKFVVPRQYPSLGEYDDSDPAVIKEHMKMFRRANIGLLVTSWWGPNRVEDSTTKDVIMQHEDVGNLKVSLFYETTNRLKNGLEDIGNAKTDIEYMCDHYFDHPNYYKIDGRPVLFIYLARTLEHRGAFEEVLLTMRSEAAKRGHNMFLVGDYVFGSSPSTTEEDPYIPFWYFDAVTNYDVYGSAGRPQGHAGHAAVSNYYEKQAEWKAETAKENCRFIPAVSPGYNDRGVRLESDHPALSRRLTADAAEGSLFHFQLKHAKKLADQSMDKLIMVNSFNEWHEDTQIEPVKIGESAVWPPIMTQDLEYVGYGNLYLDILGASTRSEEGQGIFDYLYEY